MKHKMDLTRDNPIVSTKNRHTVLLYSIKYETNLKKQTITHEFQFNNKTKSEVLELVQCYM